MIHALKTSLLIITFTVFSTATMATTEITVSGKVMSFDQNVIVIKQKSGATLKIPRSSYKNIKGIKVGQDVLELKVQPIDFVRLNPELVKAPPPGAKHPGQPVNNNKPQKK